MDSSVNDIFIYILIVILGLGLANLGLGYWLWVKFRKWSKGLGGFEEQVKDVEKQKMRIVAQTNERMVAITREYEAFVSAAQDQLSQVISPGQVKADLDRRIAELADKGAGEATAVLRQNLDKWGSSLGELLNAELNKLRGEATAAVEEKRKKVDEELETFKRTRMAELAREVDQMVKQVTMEVVGMQLSTGQQTELVIRALEKAKQENVF